MASLINRMYDPSYSVRNPFYLRFYCFAFANINNSCNNMRSSFHSHCKAAEWENLSFTIGNIISVIDTLHLNLKYMTVSDNNDLLMTLEICSPFNLFRTKNIIMFRRLHAISL